MEKINIVDKRIKVSAIIFLLILILLSVKIFKLQI